MKKNKSKIRCNYLWLLMSAIMLLGFTMFSTDLTAQQTKTISGTITDDITGEPLPGVTIQVKGTTTGTISNIDGNFTLEASANDVLVFSFVGYLSKEVSVGDQTTIETTLRRDIIGLDEVIVTGYGVQQKSLVTGSIASVSH